MQKKKQTSGRPVLPAENTFEQSRPVYISLFFADPHQKRQIVWELELEDGFRDAGKAKNNAINLPRLPLGKHKLTVIVGNPILEQRHRIYSSYITIV